jgi:hypothetical protein
MFYFVRIVIKSALPDVVSVSFLLGVTLMILYIGNLINNSNIFCSLLFKVLASLLVRQVKKLIRTLFVI